MLLRAIRQNAPIPLSNILPATAQKRISPKQPSEEAMLPLHLNGNPATEIVKAISKALDGLKLDIACIGERSLMFAARNATIGVDSRLAGGGEIRY